MLSKHKRTITRECGDCKKLISTCNKTGYCRECLSNRISDGVNGNEVNPTPEEIAALTAEIRTSWPEERLRRSYHGKDKPKSWTVPKIRVSQDTRHYLNTADDFTSGVHGIG